MKSQLFALLLLSLGLFSACKEKKNAADADTSTAIIQYDNAAKLYEDTASSSVRVFDNDGRVCIQQTSISYEMVDVYEGGKKSPLLLKITKTDLCFADSVNKNKVYQISARSVLDNKVRSWETEFVATDLHLRDKTNSLQAVLEGQDGEEDLITRFSLLDGRKIFEASYSEMLVSIPNVKSKRFVGFTSRGTVKEPIQARNEENLIGLVAYSSSEKSVNTVKIKLKRSKVADKIPTYTPDMTFVALNENVNIIRDGKEVILMKADEKYKADDVKDFAVQLTFYYGDDNEYATVTIPVLGDKLHLAGAKYDKDIFELKE
jgi:hypothetical protein